MPNERLKYGKIICQEMNEGGRKEEKDEKALDDVENGMMKTQIINGKRGKIENYRPECERKEGKDEKL